MAAAAGREGGFMVPELRRERERSALNLPELTHFIDGGEFISEMRRKVCEWDCYGDDVRGSCNMECLSLLLQAQCIDIIIKCICLVLS